MPEFVHLVSPYPTAPSNSKLNPNSLTESNENFRPPLVHLVGQELFRLTAFITFITFYFVFVTDNGDVVFTTLLKCAPIVSLGVYVYAKGFKLTDEFRYSQRILAGLAFSCVGDLLLNIDLFPFGMAAFAVAQICYIAAFELKPWKFVIGIPLYLAAGGLTAFMYSSLDAVLKIGLPIYAFLLTTMCWRSITRAIVKGGILATLCAVGSVLFVISDSLISVTMFVTSIRNERILIMTTYYAAQFFFALSTLSDVLKPKKAKGSKKLSRKFRAQD